MSDINFKIIRFSLTVSRKVFITPHYVRIYLTGKNLENIANTTVGVNNKILIPPKGVKKIHFPEMDMETFRWKPQPAAIRPVIRTFTHRGYDAERNEIWVDFVAHGTHSPASKWAMEAQPGDPIGILMNDGKIELYQPAENYLLVGDATSIPVMGTILEDLPASAKGICLLEVFGTADEQVLKTKADFQFIWLHNEHPERGSQLAETLKGKGLPEVDRFGYIAGEQSTVKAVRHYLRKEKGWGREEFYAFSYWKSGVAEDRSEVERYQETIEA